MEIVAVKGQVRDELGKKATKAVRNSALVPCVIYGGKEPVHFATDGREVKDLVYTNGFKLAQIEVGGVVYDCIVKDTQFHPVSEKLLHVDFLQLVKGAKLKVEVPVKFRGVSPGVKAGGKLLQNLRRVKIKTTIENLVDVLVLDISKLELGQSIRVRDIDPENGVEIMNAPSIPVATIEIPRALRSAAAAEKAAADKAGKKKK